MTSEAGASQSAANDIQSAAADDIQSEAEVSILPAAAAAAADESQPPAAQAHGSRPPAAQTEEYHFSDNDAGFLEIQPAAEVTADESDQIQLAADQSVTRVMEAADENQSAANASFISSSSFDYGFKTISAVVGDPTATASTVESQPSAAQIPGPAATAVNADGSQHAAPQENWDVSTVEFMEDAQRLLVEGVEALLRHREIQLAVDQMMGPYGPRALIEDATGLLEDARHSLAEVEEALLRHEMISWEADQIMVQLAADEIRPAADQIMGPAAPDQILGPAAASSSLSSTDEVDPIMLPRKITPREVPEPPMR